jgi:hypothetical protein
MPRAILILAFLIVGCSTQNVLLIHPKSGDMVECSADGLGPGVVLASQHVESCVKNFTAVGFVETDKLTPEQKAAITPSGKILQQRRQFIPQGSSSQGQQSQGLGFLCKDAIQRGDQGGIFVHC